MNRRDFCKHLSLLAAGAAALPQQLSAFEHLYEVNTKKLGESGIISIKDLFFGFENVNKSASMVVNFLNKKEVFLPFTINAFGGFIRYVSVPDCPLLLRGRDLSWEVKQYSGLPCTDNLYGNIFFIDQNGLIHNERIFGATGILKTL